MTTLTEKFDALEEQLATQAATTDSYIDTVEAKLQALFDTLDVMLINNAANTRALLQAIGQNGVCAPCPTPSIFVPPVEEIPTTANSNKCQRAQAMIHMLKTVLAALDDLMNLNVSASWTLISDVYSQIIDTLGAGDTIPLPSFPEAVNIAGNFFSFAASRLFTGETLSSVFAAVEFDLRDAIYNGGDAAGAQAAYNATIDASDMSQAAKYMLQSVAYAALWSYFINPDSEPNLTGYNGSICNLAPGGCFEFDSVAVHYTELNSDEMTTSGDFGPFTAYDEVGAFNGVNHLSVACFYDSVDMTGWTVEALSGSFTVQWRPEDVGSFSNFTYSGPYDSSDGPIDFDPLTNTWHLFSASAFSVRICSPEEV